MRKRQVYRIVMLPNGQIVKEPIEFRNTEKIRDKFIQDTDSKLWLKKKHYTYVDRKNEEEAS